MENEPDRSSRMVRGTTNPALIYLADLSKKGRFAHSRLPERGCPAAGICRCEDRPVA